MLLEVEGLAYRHTPGGGGAGPVSFTLDSGDSALLLGPSGSGKTTLLHCIAGLLTPQQGTVRIDGQSIGALGPAARDRLRRESMGLIFQTLRLVSALSVRRNLALAARLAGRPAEESALQALLERLGIAHRAHALPRQLSQGEAQRAAIARALIARPRLLIADEPTSALDDRHAAEVADLLADLASESGAALLIVTHDARLARPGARAIRLGADGRMEGAA